MLKLKHYDDKKEKYQSHEISFDTEIDCVNNDIGIYSLELTDIVGYGKTKEEALEDFKKKFKYLLDKYKIFEAVLDTSGYDIEEVK